MTSCSEDLINSFPDPLLCHILSFLTTKQAASTSVLAKRWRYLLAFVPSLEFDDTDYLHPEERTVTKLNLPKFCAVFDENNKRVKHSTSFEDFVRRVLDLQGNGSLDKVVFKILDTKDPVKARTVVPWLENVLSRRVLELCLVLDLKWIPSGIFVSETLVRLGICVRNSSGPGPVIDVVDVCLPKLKSLRLESVEFKERGVGFSKVLSGCDVLEELVMSHVGSWEWDCCVVVCETLKGLEVKETYANYVHDRVVKSVSFDVPNLVYLEYSEVIASEYPKVKLGSLVEAKIDLQIARDRVVVNYESSDSEFEDEDGQGNEVNLVGNATDFMMGICNVRILCLSASTLQILMSYCEAIPIFSNLSHLTIESKPEVGWEPLPGLLKNCPTLETLVFQGLLHNATDKCGDVCLCKPREKEDGPSCLSLSLVKVLKIVMNDGKMEKQIEQVNYFLETMPNLEHLVLYYASAFDEDVEVSTQLQMLTSVASPKCEVKLIPGKLSVSSTVPSAVSAKWIPLP